MAKSTDQVKTDFRKKLSAFVKSLQEHISDNKNEWTIKGFIDIYRNIYTISSDTKIVSKILEIHIFPRLLEFARANGYKLVLATHQNHYPDLSFVSETDEKVKFAVDLKTTYRQDDNPEFCNGFTLGSHGEYCRNRQSTKNITFPYGEYLGHYCLGIIYTRVALSIDETKTFPLDKLRSITSVAKEFVFFVCEKWEIASDKSGSGNTANIGSIKNIEGILACNGTFKRHGEKLFDDYWINYGKITVIGKDGKERKITSLNDFLAYKGRKTSANPLSPRRKP